jgi:hypothetical protein
MEDEAFILESAKLARQLIIELYKDDPTHETFEQVGLLDGAEEVRDYLEHNEIGLAVEHLLYMVHEADIQFPRDRMLRLHQLAERMGLENSYS